MKLEVDHCSQFFFIYQILDLKTPGIVLNFIGYLSLAYRCCQDIKFCNRHPANHIRTGIFRPSMIGPDDHVTCGYIFTMFVLQRNNDRGGDDNVEQQRRENTSTVFKKETSFEKDNGVISKWNNNKYNWGIKDR